jgi:hypothetical protein
MPVCVSLKADGARCTKNGDPAHDGMCGTHHNQKMRNDPVYAARFQEPPAPPANPPVLQRMDAVLAPPAAPRAPRVVAMRLPGSGHPRPQVNPALRRFNAMRTDIINIRDDLQSLIQLDRAEFGNDVIFDQLVPMFHELAEIHERMQQLRDTENPELERTILASIQRIQPFTRTAMTMAARALRRRREQALADMIRAILNNEDDHGNPVVFARDPDGSVNLRAFAQDNQSVHRSSVQDMAQKGIEKIMAGPAPEQNRDTVFEVTVAFTSQDIRWSESASYESTVQELQRDYEITESFGVKYAQVLDRVWVFIVKHAERAELTRRLAEELAEGRGMCSNGKMARLVNVLQGYDDAVAVELAPSREQFQNKIAALSALPLYERRHAASELFAEYKIPDAERDAWLEPLLEN